VRAPVERPVRLQVLGGVPERAVVRRVDGHAAVVTPPMERAVLGTGPVEHRRLLP